MATVVRTFRSAPRQADAAMVVAPDGAASGSVSGGWVENAVYELGTEVIVGLTCGGILDVFVEPVSQKVFPELAAVAEDVDGHRPGAVATVIAHPDVAWVGRRLVIRPTASTYR